MRKTMLAVLVTVAFSAVGVLGDYFLKLSSARDQSLRTRRFYVGFVVYASTAFGWVFVMRHLKLASRLNPDSESIDSCTPVYFELSVCPSMSLASARLHSRAEHLKLKFSSGRIATFHTMVSGEAKIVRLTPSVRGACGGVPTLT
jgi:hypothetical protein